MTGNSKRFLFEWEYLVATARIGRTAKLVAFVMKVHADLDGTRVRPGTARLAVLCDVSYASVKRARHELIAAGLLELERRGNRRNGHADTYRLIIADDLYDRVRVLDPDEIAAAAEKINEERQAAESARVRKRNQGSPETPESRLPAPDPGTNQGSPAIRETRYRAHHRPESGLTGDPPPSQDHQSTTTTISSGWQVNSQTARANTSARCPHTGTDLEPDGFCLQCSVVITDAP